MFCLLSSDILQELLFVYLYDFRASFFWMLSSLFYIETTIFSWLWYYLASPTPLRFSRISSCSKVTTLLQVSPSSPLSVHLEEQPEYHLWWPSVKRVCVCVCVFGQARLVCPLNPLSPFYLSILILSLSDTFLAPFFNKYPKPNKIIGQSYILLCTLSIKVFSVSSLRF